MKELKKNPRKQLEKFSSIFTQLGLVLTLFIVFISLEHETEKKLGEVFVYEPDLVESVFVFSKEPIVIKRVEKNVKKVIKRETVKTVAIPKVVKNTAVVVETVIKPIENTTTVDLVPTKEEKEVVELVEKPISINNVQKTPVFKGCEGLSEKESRKCFENKIQKHVQRYFDAEIAQDLGLQSGKYKIFTQFVIDKSGTVSNIKIRAPHKRLEKETNKVVGKIPKFTPGKQNNKPVKVKYTLPITFKVE